MKYSLNTSLQILERTPRVLAELLSDLDAEWTNGNEGADTWSPFDVMGHLLHGERTDWMARVSIIMREANDKRFKSFDRFAQFEESKGKTLAQLLEEFKEARAANLRALRDYSLSEQDLERTGIHPVFGTVTLRQLLSTWTVHDLAHILQISRTMAKQYRAEIGPWAQYFSLMQNSSQTD